MGLLNLLFWRPGGADVDQLPPSTRRRLREHIERLTDEEDQVRRKLDLVCAPRLSIVDEESASLLRASDRPRLLARRP
ncbi:MAG TPA: hypothetical protein VK001_03665 [Geminicoccaceae bacterium]|nr:hypothetical protein [Geminicoccaceae bacterium]